MKTHKVVKVKKDCHADALYLREAPNRSPPSAPCIDNDRSARRDDVATYLPCWRVDVVVFAAPRRHEGRHFEHVPVQRGDDHGNVRARRLAQAPVVAARPRARGEDLPRVVPYRRLVVVVVVVVLLLLQLLQLLQLLLLLVAFRSGP